MTRKDYILIAETLRKAGEIHVGDDYQRGKKAGVLVAVEFIADALKGDNPKFDRARFIAAVKGEE